MPRPRRCKQCREQFTPSRQLQAVCSPSCAAKYVIEQRAKIERRELLDAKQRIKPRSKWMAEAQQVFNAWVRQRDCALPCISCGRFHHGQWHAGHFLSTGARPELRFDEANVHRQCQPCNTHLHGNLVLYRAELIRRVGLAEVERLEGPQAPRHYTVDDFRAIKATYAAKTRALKAGTDSTTA
jgi:hypothetical protein